MGSNGVKSCWHPLETAVGTAKAPASAPASAADVDPIVSVLHRRAALAACIRQERDRGTDLCGGRSDGAAHPAPACSCERSRCSPLARGRRRHRARRRVGARRTALRGSEPARVVRGPGGDAARARRQDLGSQDPARPAAVRPTRRARVLRRARRRRRSAARAAALGGHSRLVKSLVAKVCGVCVCVCSARPKTTR